MRKSRKDALRRALNCGLKGGFSFSGMGGIFGFESRLCGGGLLRARTRFGAGVRRVWNEPLRGLGRAWFRDSAVPANIRAFNPRCLRACKFFAKKRIWRVWRACARAFFARSCGVDCRGRAAGKAPAFCLRESCGEAFFSRGCLRACPRCCFRSCSVSRCLRACKFFAKKRILACLACVRAGVFCAFVRGGLQGTRCGKSARFLPARKLRGSLFLSRLFAGLSALLLSLLFRFALFARVQIFCEKTNFGVFGVRARGRFLRVRAGRIAGDALRAKLWADFARSARSHRGFSTCLCGKKTMCEGRDYGVREKFSCGRLRRVLEKLGDAIFFRGWEFAGFARRVPRVEGARGTRGIV